MKPKKAVVITGGYFDTDHGKTCHGLIRGSERFEVVGVIDGKQAGKDAGEVLDGKHRGIPIYPDLDTYAAQSPVRAAYCIVGVATKGGVIPTALKDMLATALRHHLSLVNGLHHLVSDIPELVTLAEERALEITDIRKPKPFKELHFWSGDIKKVGCPRVPVLGTDCALGKRTTARFLTEAMRRAGYKAEMIYTGQTGWMQGSKYGFIFDSTLNDFVSGELEHAIVQCWEEAQPDIIFIEGQSSLRNPSGPAGAELIISADATGVVLQHDPGRRQYKDMEHYPAYLPSIEEEVRLIGMYGAHTVAITISTHKISEAEAREYASTCEKELGIPTILPLEDGVGRLVPVFQEMMKDFKTPKQ